MTTTTVKHTTRLLVQEYHENELKIPVHMYEIETIDQPGLSMCRHKLECSYLCGQSFKERKVDGEDIILTDAFNVDRIMRDMTLSLDTSWYCSRKLCKHTVVRRTMISQRPLHEIELMLSPEAIYADRMDAIHGYAALVED